MKPTDCLDRIALRYGHALAVLAGQVGWEAVGKSLGERVDALPKKKLDGPMSLSEFFEASGYGAQMRLATEIGVAPSDLAQWSKNNRPVPAHRAVQIERATGGAVTRRVLRPKDWADYWPELATQPATATN